MMALVPSRLAHLLSPFPSLSAARGLGLGLGLAVLAGCATPPPPRIYTLQAEAPLQAAAAAGGPAVLIDLASVALPERLRRRQMVLRADGTEMKALEQSRWSSSFDDEVQDALSAALQGRLHAVDVSKGGLAGKRPAYRITVEFSRLDARLGGPVQAAVSWSVRQATGDGVQVCRAHFTEPASGASVADIVAAHQRLIGQVADAIAATQRAVDGPAPAQYCK